ncbi:hypothetical protein CLF_110112 [Clonorchis sinensis]|uniref:Uncharacterized protein n=1 Tax=Clonorchis sinensis TaxID=79923 RepID=G7YT66_CLOSI|nr:hypothetical protein CLF_110112 [Clonorchis sinensis]
MRHQQRKRMKQLARMLKKRQACYILQYQAVGNGDLPLERRVNKERRSLPSVREQSKKQCEKPQPATIWTQLQTSDPTLKAGGRKTQKLAARETAFSKVPVHLFSLSIRFNKNEKLIMIFAQSNCPLPDIATRDNLDPFADIRPYFKSRRKKNPKASCSWNSTQQSGVFFEDFVEAILSSFSSIFPCNCRGYCPFGCIKVDRNSGLRYGYPLLIGQAYSSPNETQYILVNETTQKIAGSCPQARFLIFEGSSRNTRRLHPLYSPLYSIGYTSVQMMQHIQASPESVTICPHYRLFCQMVLHLSMVSCVLPTSRKKIKSYPIYLGGRRLAASDYIPISLTSIPCAKHYDDNSLARYASEESSELVPVTENQGIGGQTISVVLTPWYLRILYETTQ